jgi:RNA polymerase sigma factor (sigma-70 family)
MHIDKPGDSNEPGAVLGFILDHNKGRWFRFTMAILKNEADAEDALQEAVCRVLSRNLPLLSHDEARMYLGRAIGNTALEFYNSRKRERLRQIPVYEDILIASGAQSQHACMEESEISKEEEYMLRRIHDLLALLPLKQREALRITILESRGLSIREAAIACGIPYSTLRHRSKMGIKQLRKFLEKERKHLRNQKNLRLTNDD